MLEYDDVQILYIVDRYGRECDYYIVAHDFSSKEKPHFSDCFRDYEWITSEEDN